MRIAKYLWWWFRVKALDTMQNKIQIHRIGELNGNYRRKETCACVFFKTSYAGMTKQSYRFFCKLHLGNLSLLEYWRNREQSVATSKADQCSNEYYSDLWVYKRFRPSTYRSKWRRLPFYCCRAGNRMGTENYRKAVRIALLDIWTYYFFDGLGFWKAK